MTTPSAPTATRQGAQHPVPPAWPGAAATLILLCACKPVEAPRLDVTDPAALFARALAEPPPPAMYAHFDAVIAAPGQRLALNGTLVVSPPDRFRVELRGPIGPAQLVMTCDGRDLRAWVAPKNSFYQADDADGTLGGLLGVGDGVHGAAVVTSLLMGRMPSLPMAPELTAAGPVATARWARADGATFSLGIDGRTAHLVDARATDERGRVLFSGAWVPGEWPRALNVVLPTLDASADVRFGDWAPATPTDAAFRLTAPPGSVAVPLVLTPDGG
ncbi:MAG: hypothetical protein EXR71_18990 [Myxococcales bacterium]|nr:hypothetical protein [Myxococcales bacterium]